MEDLEEEVKECEHKEICPVPHYSMKCIFNKEECQVKKFYDKYGTEYNQMYIGSKI